MNIENVAVYVTDHFKESEFFTKSPDFKGKKHYLDDNLIQAVEYIREFFKQPITITSTYRTEEHNRLIGGAENSYHRKGKAMDFQSVSERGTFVNMVKKHYENDRVFRSKLDSFNIKGIIFYDTFIHIDTRDEPYKSDKRILQKAGGVGGLLLLILIWIVGYELV